MVVKAATRILAVFAVAALCVACGKRESGREEVVEEMEIEASPAGCCQQANSMCESPLTREECGKLGGTWMEGATCGDDGQCTTESPQPESPDQQQ